MPTSIIVAVISLFVMMAGRLTMTLLREDSGISSILHIIIPFSISILILVGIINGHKLAWQWGRIIGLLGSMAMSALSAVFFAMKEPMEGKIFLGTMMLIQAVAFYAMFRALGTAEAKKHFGLICPQCGTDTAKAGDFLFTQAVCRNCNARW